MRTVFYAFLIAEVFSFRTEQVGLDFRIQNEILKIAYGINSQIGRTVIEEGEYCDNDVAAGLVFYLYNESKEVFYPEAPIIPDSIDYKPMPKERLQSIMEQSRIEFVKKTRVFKARERIKFVQKIKLKDYQLEKGTYYFQVLYFSGEHITNYVSRDQIAIDRRVNNAIVYQGCVKSNRVKLLVK